MNTFGTLFRLTTFGESHGPAIGGVIDGCPPNIKIDLDFIQYKLDLRKPGTEQIYSQRKEPDKVQFISGIFQNKTTGAPIAFIIPNTDTKTSDYKYIKNIFRPSHGDFTYFLKYKNYDWRGGGRFSARETAARIVAGAIAQLVLNRLNIQIFSFTSQIGNIKLEKNYSQLNLSLIYSNPVRCPHPPTAEKMLQSIENIRQQGDSIGGSVSTVVKNMPPGLGQPLYDKLSARLAYAMFSINAVKGFEIGSGFNAASMTGSQHNDLFYLDQNKKIKTKTNNNGGIQAGISNGMDLLFKVAFKPPSTIMKPQPSVSKNLKPAILPPKGRHDPCIVPRAVPVVESMTAITLLDFILINNAYNDFI